jgi:hypothetical protein
MSPPFRQLAHMTSPTVMSTITFWTIVGTCENMNTSHLRGMDCCFGLSAATILSTTQSCITISASSCHCMIIWVAQSILIRSHSMPPSEKVWAHPLPKPCCCFCCSFVTLQQS